MILTGKILVFNDIFKFIPKTIVANDLGKKVDRFSELMRRVECFTLEELFMIAMFCNIGESQILELALNDYRGKRSGGERSNTS